jgi:hypothetical protein
VNPWATTRLGRPAIEAFGSLDVDVDVAFDGAGSPGVAQPSRVVSRSRNAIDPAVDDRQGRSSDRRGLVNEFLEPRILNGPQRPHRSKRSTP